MEAKSKIALFLHKPLFHKYSTLLVLWLLIAIIAWLTKYFPQKYNNFLIFKNVFWHTINQLPLYISYIGEYNDINHYGPFFSIVIAPFALVPLWLGLLAWLGGLSFFLYIAVRSLPIEQKKHIFIYWFCAHELMTAIFMSQFNVAIAAIIIITYAALEKEKEWLAALMIVLGTFVKLYGIVGLAFFFFSKNKLKFIGYGLLWSVVMFVLPMVISSPNYIIEQYGEWFNDIAFKNGNNTFALMQNVSLLGMIRKISMNPNYSDLYIILCGLALFGIPYLRRAQYKYVAFRETILASVLLFVVLFSTGSESSSYIIALCGVAIWYVASPWKRNSIDIGLMIFAFILTSMSPSDLFPRYLKIHYVYPYALKALPCVLIWLKLTYELCFKDYRRNELQY
ncbi:MAG: glycosyltransferase family 87 protein [Bacteroidales bacterium]